MLWMSPSMTLIVICVLAAPAITVLRPSPCFRANGACLQIGWGAHDGTYARSIGTDPVVKSLAWRSYAKRVASMVVAADGAGTHRCRYPQAMLAQPCWLPVIGRSSCCAMAAGGNEWAHRSGNLRCVREFSRYVDRPHPRVLASFLGYCTAHTGVGRARLRAYRHAFSHEDGTIG